jgi:hypothetical protein
VPYEPYCWIKGGVVIFFYVDDIVVTYRKAYTELARTIIRGIRSKYAL